MSTEFWDRQAGLPGGRAVIDPNDLAGHKNAYIDCLHKRALKRYADLGPLDRVLDFGCGYGRITLWLASRVASVHGVEMSRAMLRRAACELNPQRLRNVCVSAYDGSRLPFHASSFSRVTCVWVVQHIIDDAAAESVLCELARVTRPGGRLVFIERVSDQPEEPWLPAGVIRRRRHEEYGRLFSASGLKCVLSRPIQDSTPIWHSRRFDRLVTGGRIPVRVFPAVACVDVALKQFVALGEWVDYCFVCLRL